MTRRPMPGPGRRGVILIAALLVLAMLTVMTTAFIQNEQVEVRLAARHWERAQARQAAWSGIHRAMADVASDDDPQDGLFEDWQGLDAETYHAVAVGDAAYFSLLRHDPNRPDDIAYGITDENGKVDINSAAPEILAALPGMDEDLAAAIIDWRDEDDDPQEGNGAESEYYLTLPRPYRPKNAPFESIEELLLVRGFTTALLYGEDLNRNGVLDPNENDGSDSPPDDDADGILNRGLAPLITCWSRTRNVDAAGQARVNVNTATAEQIQEAADGALNTADAQAILQARQLRGGEFQTLGDLLDAQGMTVEKYQQVIDHFTLSDETELPGLININTAPREVLLAILPGQSQEEIEALADEIMDAREDPEIARMGLGWLLEIESLRNDQTGGGVLPYARYRALTGLVTTRSDQFRVESLGWSAGRTAFARWEAIIDRRSGAAKIVRVRDVSRLGLPEALPEADEISTPVTRGGTGARRR